MEQWETVVAEPYESVEPCEENEKAELDEHELERECEDEAETMETGEEEVDRGGGGMAGSAERKVFEVDNDNDLTEAVAFDVSPPAGEF